MSISEQQRELLEHLIPYRMKAVSALGHALRLRSQWETAPNMTMFVNGKQVLEGNLNAYTNPVIEAGLIHSRALLEFLGLCELGSVLSNIDPKRRRPGDHSIEQFRSDGAPLKMVDVESVLARYKSDPAEAEQALLTIFRLTNKGLAHITDSLLDSPKSVERTLVASSGIPSLMVTYLYTPMGMRAQHMTSPHVLAKDPNAPAWAWYNGTVRPEK